MRQRDRETERQRDRETEILRDMGRQKKEKYKANLICIQIIYEA